METQMKPVPAFYCCYLLRSTVRHSSLYIGSSPDPARRLAQHNGKVKGGAVRTSRLSLRPWEMVCFVSGFPSNIGALQFEWAWHNPHLTKHISSGDRVSLPTSIVKTNKRTGKTRKKVGRPRTSLIDKLANLHLLLQSSYFSKWPLQLQFFNETVYKSWLAWLDRTSEGSRSQIPAILDYQQKEEEPQNEFSSGQKAEKRRKADLIGKGGVDGIDPTYACFQPVLHKLKGLIDRKGLSHACTICRRVVNMKTTLYNICLHDNCSSITHLDCLASHFLGQGDSTALIPKQGNCPSCHSESLWIDLMRVLTIRTRADKEVTRLLKRKRSEPAAMVAELSDNESDTADDEILSLTSEASDSSDCETLTSTTGPALRNQQQLQEATSQAMLKVGGSKPPRSRIEMVIEDSEEDNL